VRRLEANGGGPHDQDQGAVRKSPRMKFSRNSRRTETSMRSSHRPAECGVRLSKIT
jgi:hypothetical protein